MMDFRPIRDRACIVCVQCHARKVKCDLQASPDKACSNCRRSSQACVQRNGVRKKRKGARKRAIVPTGQIPVFAEGDAENFGILSPTQSSDTAATLATAASTRQPNCYIANESILSYDLPSEQEPSDVISSRVSIFESLLRDIQVTALPRPALLGALKDAFIEHVAPFYPILDIEDISSDDTPVMLQLATCLVGSLMRHDQKELEFAASQYERIKSLIYLGSKHDPLVLLKTCCLMACWSPNSTDVITLDGPWQWVGVAIRLAIQMGLHKQATYINNPKASSFRRVFWHLVMTDKMMVACWGRPSMLRPDDFDTHPLTLNDFPTQTYGHSSLFFLQGCKIIDITGSIAELHLQKRNLLSEEIDMIVARLCDWQTNLPAGVQLFNPGGSRHPFSRIASDVHIQYFGAIIMTDMLSQRHSTHWQPSASSLVASLCIVSLYEEILSREQAVYLLHYHGFYCMAAALPLLFLPQRLVDKYSILCDIEILTSVLNCMSAKYGGAAFVLRKINQIRNYSESIEQPIREGANLTTYHHLGSFLEKLFPFPTTFYKRMDISDLNEPLSGEISQATPLGSNLTMFDMLGMDIGSFSFTDTTDFLVYDTT
ncbi:fungal-specific transcription factor domain-containing protein [Trichoderma evansii]